MPVVAIQKVRAIRGATTEKAWLPPAVATLTEPFTPAAKLTGRDTGPLAAPVTPPAGPILRSAVVCQQGCKVSRLPNLVPLYRAQHDRMALLNQPLEEEVAIFADPVTGKEMFPDATPALAPLLGVKVAACVWLGI